MAVVVPPSFLPAAADHPLLPALQPAAAYRAGARLHEHAHATCHDYTAKAGRVVVTEIIVPAHMPDAFQDRARLWNTVEQTEKRRDARLAREFLLSLPHDLSDGKRIALMRGFRARAARFGSTACPSPTSRARRCAPAEAWPRHRKPQRAIGPNSTSSPATPPGRMRPARVCVRCSCGSTRAPQLLILIFRAP